MSPPSGGRSVPRLDRANGQDAGANTERESGGPDSRFPAPRLVDPVVRHYGRDDTLCATHGDVVAVRDGYHPFVTAYGYDAYYLNVLAGARRSMAASDDPRYAQVRHDWPPPNPRLPLVPRP